MAIKTRSIDDSSEVAAEASDVAADDSDLANASLPIAIGDPAEPKEIPLANLMEYIYDAIASFLTAGSNVSVTHDDANDTLTIAATDTNTQKSDESIRDLIASFIVAGTNVSVAHDDANDTLTITTTDTDTNTQRTDEEIRDVIAAFATAGSNLTITHDDDANTLTFSHTFPSELWLDGSKTTAVYKSGMGDDGYINRSISPTPLSSSFKRYSLVGKCTTRVDNPAGGTLGGGDYDIDVFICHTYPASLFAASGDRIHVFSHDGSWAVLEYTSTTAARLYVDTASDDDMRYVGLIGHYY